MNSSNKLKENKEFCGMSLHDFQSSGGIPFDRQLILLKNKKAFSMFTPVKYPYLKDQGISESFRKLFWRMRTGKKSNSLFVPPHANDLFLGYYDQSFDNCFPSLETLFRLIKGYPERQFKLVLGKGDYVIESSFAELIPKNLLWILANNVNVKHEKIRYLPMGRDFRNMEFLKHSSPTTSKATLCYCNFSRNTHPIREDVYSALKSKDFIEFEHMGNFLEYSVARDDFLQRLASAKFSICPRGNAVDTFRLWDSLYVGTIPIVIKEAVFHEMIDDLPILFLKDIADYQRLNAADLESIYQSYLHKKFNYSKLCLDFWIDSHD